MAAKHRCFADVIALEHAGALDVSLLFLQCGMCTKGRTFISGVGAETWQASIRFTTNLTSAYCIQIMIGSSRGTRGRSWEAFVSSRNTNVIQISQWWPISSYGTRECSFHVRYCVVNCEAHKAFFIHSDNIPVLSTLPQDLGCKTSVSSHSSTSIPVFVF